MSNLFCLSFENVSPVGRKLFPFRTDPFSEKGLGHRKANRCHKTYLPCKMAEPASVAQLDPRPTGDQEVAGSTPAGSTTLFRGD